MRNLAKTNRNENTLDFFDDFFKPLDHWFDNIEDKQSGFYPPVNIQENEKEYQLDIVAPGLEKEDFKIRTEGDLLTISSEKEEQKEENKKHLRKEYSFHHSFKRSFSISDDIDQEKVEANYHNGVLHLVLPKKEEKIVKPQEITVK